MWKEIIDQTDTTITIRVWAWENRDEFVHWSLDAWYCGIENLVSIPWAVGAAPMQNIGAYGVEVWSLIESVECVDQETGEMFGLTADACHFWYRDSIFKHELKNKAIITHVTFILHKYSPENYTPKCDYWAIKQRLTTPHPTPTQLANTISEIRASKLPDYTTIGTAWSFF